MAKRNTRAVSEHRLSRRERQIMNVVYRLGQASVAEIVESLPDPPTQDAIRRLCHILEDKGRLLHRQDGHRNVYYPTVKPEQARKSALDNLIDTFFGGSTPSLVAALLDTRRDELTDDDIRRMADMIAAASKKETGA